MELHIGQLITSWPLYQTRSLTEQIITRYKLCSSRYDASKNGGHAYWPVKYRSYLNTSSEPGLHRPVVGVIGPSFIACTGPITSLIR
jgi:hypothetical protein